MSLAGLFWRRICEPLDGFLWHKDISHPIIRPVARNVILASGLCILAGGCLFAVVPWLFWFGCGLLGMCWIFWSWAKFFLRSGNMAFSSSIMGVVLFHFLGRLGIMGLLLYVAMSIFQASAIAIMAGFICGAFICLASYALNMGV